VDARCEFGAIVKRLAWALRNARSAAEAGVDVAIPALTSDDRFALRLARFEGVKHMSTAQWIGHAGELFVCATATHTAPRYWIAVKREVGELCVGALRQQNVNPME
jgi:hypothetical protein